MTTKRIPVTDLEAYCAAYGPELVNAIRLQFPHADGAHQIPLDQWYRLARSVRRKSPPRGLGDLVAAVAQPIARAIDAAAGTKLAECGGCKKRRAALNRIHL
jgi:hypothetical protein